MNVLVLMSGSSQAFNKEGYGYPKNLMEIAGRPLVQHVMESLSSLKKSDSCFICVLPRDENRKNHTGKVLQLIDPQVTVLEVSEENSGAACSALLAIDHINTDEPLIISNGDQILDGLDLGQIVQDFSNRSLAAGVIVFEAIHPRWSFVKCDSNGNVVEAAEKRPISKLATAGFYYFAKGSEFVRAAMEMIKKDSQVNGLFYICPALNEMILRQARIGIHEISRKSYISLANPKDAVAYSNALTNSQHPSTP